MYKISVIIPVYNEETTIAGTISYLRLTSPSEFTEIIVVDGGSTDNAVKIASQAADTTIKLSKPGRAYQMHQASLAASGDIFLFLHADTRLPDNWFNILQDFWSRKPQPVATAFKLSFDSDKFRYKLLAALANKRTRMTNVPHGDQAIAVGRDYYLKAGGFPPVPIMEEYCFVRKLHKFGRVFILNESVRTSVRRYESNGWFFNSLRNNLIIFLFYLGVSPHRLARLYK